MQTIERRTEGGRMAMWRATGGAQWMAGAGAEPAGDDGLRATTLSFRPPFCADDGLIAGISTYVGCGLADDGLRAGGNTYRFCADDGLEGGERTAWGCVDGGR